MTYFDQCKFIKKCIRLPIEFDAARALSEVRSIPRDQFDSSSRGPTHQDVQGIFIRGYPPRLAKPDVDRLYREALWDPVQKCFVQSAAELKGAGDSPAE